VVSGGGIVIPYEPRYFYRPRNLIDVPTAWKGIESILHDLISRFCPDATRCLEIGVDYGYSTVALSNFFASVVGVDTFRGDEHAGARDVNLYERVRDALLAYPNIRLVQADYRDFFQSNPCCSFDLAHIDIIHTYDDTLACGRLAWEVSRMLMFHDTRSFPEVMRAVTDLADETGAQFYEWPECNGVGILKR
jgi:hypothetical protein